MSEVYTASLDEETQVDDGEKLITMLCTGFRETLRDPVPTMVMVTEPASRQARSASQCKDVTAVCGKRLLSSHGEAWEEVVQLTKMPREQLFMLRRKTAIGTQVFEGRNVDQSDKTVVIQSERGRHEEVDLSHAEQTVRSCFLDETLPESQRTITSESDAAEELDWRAT